jgi:hypothetical protein
MCTSTSSRTPDMPSGSRTPSASSTMKACGSTWMISRSCGTLMARAASTARSTSVDVTSRSRPETATTPRLLSERMWPPATPAYTRPTSTPAICSASATACLMASTVESMFTTTPRRRPREGALPTPTTSRAPPGLGAPITAQIFVVPTSSPTTSSGPLARLTGTSLA